MSSPEEPVEVLALVSDCDTESQQATKSDTVEVSVPPSSTATECAEAPLLTVASPKAAGPNPAWESTGVAASDEARPACLSRAEAARLNGAKSRGPRTEEGKERSRHNAVKHGLTARTLLLALATEDQRAFEDVLEGLRETHHPCGYEQCQLVELAALELWRLAQAARLEARDFTHKQIFSCAVPDRLSRYHTSAWKRYNQVMERLTKLQVMARAAGAIQQGQRGMNVPVGESDDQ